jgi:hypothetical protein
MTTALERYKKAEAVYFEAQQEANVLDRQEWVNFLGQLGVLAEAALDELRLLPDTSWERKRIEQQRRLYKRLIRKLAR